MRKVKLVVVVCLLGLVLVGGVKVRNRYWESERYRQLIEKLVKNGFEREWVVGLFSNEEVRFYPQIPEIFERAKQAKKSPYSKFLTPESVERGRRFLTENDSLLSDVQRLYKVDKEVIVALLRVESDFGRNCGRYQAFGALNSIIYFSKDSSRIEWAQNELANLLVLLRELGKNPFAIKSSYAGALGWCQFLPSSYIVYGVDGDSDGTVDLWSKRDAVYSIGFYLASHNWIGNPRRAVYSYNRSRYFVNYVFEYARRLRETVLASK